MSSVSRSIRLSLESRLSFELKNSVLLMKLYRDPCIDWLILACEIRFRATTNQRGRYANPCRVSWIEFRPLQWGKNWTYEDKSLFAQGNLTLVSYFSQRNLKVSSEKRKPRKTLMLPRGRCQRICCGWAKSESRSNKNIRESLLLSCPRWQERSGNKLKINQ